jgi:phosphate transport system permease protein
MSRAWLVDWVFKNLTLVFALTTILLIVSIAFMLYRESLSNIHHSGVGFYKGKVWDPVAPEEGKPTGNLFGALPFIYGTLITSFIALLIAVPLGVGAAIFLAELSPRWLSGPISFLVELLAAVPSIVYGFWALKYLSPLFFEKFEPWLVASFGKIPFFAAPPDSLSGSDYLIAGVILSLMVLPFITAISRDVLRTVPSAQREAAYGLGATRWEAIKGAVLRYGSSGIIGAVMLGLGRALGETMAVTIVIGNNTSNFPKWGDPATFSLMRPGNTMASLLANQYPGPESPLHASALTQIALTLFVVTVLVNGLARGLVWLTAAKAVSSGPEWTHHAKIGIGSALRWGVIGLVTLLFLYQIGNDIQTRGAAGLLGTATVLGGGLLALTLFNRWVPGKPIFLTWRRINNGFSIFLCALCVLIAGGMLLTLLFFVAKDGFSSLDAQFFRPPKGTEPELGGMLHAILGTGMLVLFASLFGIPFGILGGIYLAEFGNNRIGAITRFAADLLNGVPSIVIGIFAYALVVKPTVELQLPGMLGYFLNQGSFGTAGAFALGVMMIPTVMRTTEELVRLVPDSLREGSLALGATHARTIWKVVLPVARGGILTGALLAVARIAGETAPLLMIGLASDQFITLTGDKAMSHKIATLPVEINTLRELSTPLATRQSWGIALILVMMVLIFSILARIATRDKMRMTA